MAYDDHLFTGWHVTIHGADADQVTIRQDHGHNAVYLLLTRERNIGIRIGLDEPSAELERDRLGLRQLAKLATQMAQQIEARQRAAQIEAEATYAELAETPCARAEADHPEPAGPHGPR